MKPREYQEHVLNELFLYFTKNHTGNPVVAMPTGTGKSIIVGGFVWWVMSQWPTQRIMMLTHVKELIAQNADKLQQMWPQAPLGIYSAGLGVKQASYPITFAGIQSVRDVAPMFGHVDILLIDECHLVSPNDETSYQKFINDLRKVNPHLRVIGLSATPYRLGLGLITDGGIFTDIAVDMTTLEIFNWFFDVGYLCPLIPRPTKTELDLTGVKRRGGEYVEKDLQRAVDKAEITEAALRESMELAQSRARILVFTTGVEHAEHVTDALRMLGESAVCVHSKMSSAQRDAALEAHRSGAARWLVNNNVLTTGYDDPAIDCIVMLRPTGSPGLWVQMLGRGTRPLWAPGSYYGSMVGHNGGPALDPKNFVFDLETAEGRLASIAASAKQNCLVLDFAANTLALGPINDPVIPKMKGKGGGPPPVKFCQTDGLVQPMALQPNAAELIDRGQTYESDGVFKVTGCGAYNHTSARFCCDCGAAFHFKPKISTKASETELIARQRRKDKKEDGETAPHDALPQVEDFNVDTVVYAVHEKAGGTPSLKVTYHCGLRAFSEWVPAWHESNVKFRGRKWWEERSSIPVPDTVEEAVEVAAEELAQPKTVRVWINKKYPEILGHVF